MENCRLVSFQVSFYIVALFSSLLLYNKVIRIDSGVTVIHILHRVFTNKNNPSEGIPADVTGGDDVATRKYKSTCGGDSGSFKVKEALAGMQEVWHATQRLVPSGNHGYICNLGRSPSGTRAASKTLWERQCPRHHTDKSLPSVERHSLGRED